jgi:hypothetical protein
LELIKPVVQSSLALDAEEQEVSPKDHGVQEKEVWTPEMEGRRQCAQITLYTVLEQFLR